MNINVNSYTTKMASWFSVCFPNVLIEVKEKLCIKSFALSFGTRSLQFVQRNAPCWMYKLQGEDLRDCHRVKDMAQSSDLVPGHNKDHHVTVT